MGIWLQSTQSIVNRKNVAEDRMEYLPIGSIFEVDDVDVNIAEAYLREPDGACAGGLLTEAEAKELLAQRAEELKRAQEEADKKKEQKFRSDITAAQEAQETAKKKEQLATAKLANFQKAKNEKNASRKEK